MAVPTPLALIVNGSEPESRNCDYTRAELLSEALVEWRGLIISTII